MKQKPMTPDELRDALEAAGLSQRLAAKKLGIDERTMRRYVSGDRPIPHLLRVALEGITRNKP